MSTIEHADHSALNETRTDAHGLIKFATYDRDQARLEEFDCTTVILLDEGKAASDGYSVVAIPDGGFLLGTFHDPSRLDQFAVHFARIEYGDATRVAYA